MSYNDKKEKLRRYENSVKLANIDLKNVRSIYSEYSKKNKNEIVRLRIPTEDGISYIPVPQDYLMEILAYSEGTLTSILREYPEHIERLKREIDEE